MRSAAWLPPASDPAREHSRGQSRPEGRQAGFHAGESAVGDTWWAGQEEKSQEERQKVDDLRGTPMGVRSLPASLDLASDPPPRKPETRTHGT